MNDDVTRMDKVGNECLWHWNWNHSVPEKTSVSVQLGHRHSLLLLEVLHPALFWRPRRSAAAAATAGILMQSPMTSRHVKVKGVKDVVARTEPPSAATVGTLPDGLDTGGL